MDSAVKEGDRLYLIAERLAREFDLFPSADPDALFRVDGLLSKEAIAAEIANLNSLDIDSYIERVVSPGENTRRSSAVDVLDHLGTVLSKTENGSYLDATLEMPFPSGPRPIGVIAQNRNFRNGEWMPEHHRQAAMFVRHCSHRRLPIVSLMDTPGAAGDELANSNNQAHQISLLIAEMSDVDVPNLGVIYGIGYSGGAIPLAASNMILSLRDGVFSTIQPRSLANIARRLNLSWQECAKQVGLSPFELMAQGNIDGIIDYVPGEDYKVDNLRQAIMSGIDSIEHSAHAFVGSNPYIVDYHQQTLDRFLVAERRTKKLESPTGLGRLPTPTEFSNVFGEAYRYLRYLRVRRRIKASSRQQYGRLAASRQTVGELQTRVEKERNRIYFRWLLDPDRLIYDKSLTGAWTDYLSKKAARFEERGALSKLLRGEPARNLREARQLLLSTVIGYLYNHWKTEASGNLELLHRHLANATDSAYFLNPSDIPDAQQLIDAVSRNFSLLPVLLEKFSFDGKKMFLQKDSWVKSYSENQLRTQLSVELNLALAAQPLAGTSSDDASKEVIRQNRQYLSDQLGGHLNPPVGLRLVPEETKDLSILDVMLNEDLRDDFIAEIRNFQLLDHVYDGLLDRLVLIAEQAQRTQSLDEQTVRQLISDAFNDALNHIDPDVSNDVAVVEQRQRAFLDWYRQFAGSRSHRGFSRPSKSGRNSYTRTCRTLCSSSSKSFSRAC